LRKFRGYLDVEDEIDEMKVEARKSQSVEEFSLKKLLTTPELRVPIIIACCLQIAQQFSGINAVSNNWLSPFISFLHLIRNIHFCDVKSSEIVYVP
jgi:hypothetical protein